MREIYSRGTSFFSHAEAGHVLGACIADPKQLEAPIPPEFHRKVVAMDCQFVYQSDKFADGSPLTMKELHARRKNRDALDGKLLYDTDWYEAEPFFTTQTPTTGWFIKSHAVVPNTLGKNCVQGSLVVADFVEELFGDALATAWKDTIAELRDKAKALEKLCAGNKWKEGAKQWSELAFSQLFLNHPVEILCQSLLSQGVNKERLFVSEYGRTKQLSADGRVVSVGDAGEDGARVGRWNPGNRGDGLGFFLSCSAELWAES
jgi:hypothetical protein